jgi:hypothetical protein
MDNLRIEWGDYVRIKSQPRQRAGRGDGRRESPDEFPPSPALIPQCSTQGWCSAALVYY